MAERKSKRPTLRKRLRPKRQTQRDNAGIPSVWRLIGLTYRTLTNHWKLLLAITLIYFGLYVLFVRNAPELSVRESRDFVSELLGGQSSEVITTLTTAGTVLATAGQSETGQVLYGGLFFVVFSLVFIWALRRLFATKPFRLRDTLYRSQTPLIPFVLLLLLIAVQLLPFGLGGLLYSIVQANNIATSGAETLLFVIIWLGLGLLSGYWLSNSLMSIYAVTLPGMYPIAALKATKELVKHRRWFVLRKILFLLAVLGLLFLVTLLFTVAVAPSLNLWLIDWFVVASVPITHTYLYHLYRSLI